MSVNDPPFGDLLSADLFKVDSFQNFFDLHGVGENELEYSDGGAQGSESVSHESGASGLMQPFTVQSRTDGGNGATETGSRSPLTAATTKNGYSEGKRKPRRDPEKNRSAQARYRQKVKAKAAHFEDTITALQAQVAALMQEKVDLHIRCSVLEGLADAQDAHLDRVRSDKALNDVEEQISILGEAAQLSGDVQGHPVTLEEAKDWTLKDLMQMRQRGLQLEMDWLLSGAGDDPQSPAGQQLTDFILRRRKVNYRIAVGNPKSIQGIYAFERMQAEEMADKPTEALWKRVLESMVLSPEQQKLFSEARSSLLACMTGIAARRAQLLRHAQDFHTNNAAAALRESLDEERKGVRNFLVCFFDEVLSPIQEARCDVYSFPFCPHVLALANILAGGSSSSQPTVLLPDASSTAAALGIDNWPAATPFRALSLPATTRCYILTLQRAVFMHRTGATPVQLPDLPRSELMEMSVLAFGR